MPSELAGKTVLITGATTGIGLATARALARMGATVALVGRTQEKAEAAAQALRADTSNATIVALGADLSSQAAIRQLASEVSQRFPQLDVLINNAGAAFTQRQVTVDGIEMTLAVNHLAPFLLTHHLLPTLKASSASRIVNVASTAHTSQHLHLEDVESEKRPYQWLRAYGEAKLANIMFTYALARRLAGSRVTANCLHPGFVASQFGKNNGGMWVPIFNIIRPFQISVQKGAETSVYLAASPEVDGVSGKYFDKMRAVPSSPTSYDVETQESLWAVSEQLTRLAGA